MAQAKLVRAGASVVVVIDVQESLAVTLAAAIRL